MANRGCVLSASAMPLEGLPSTPKTIGSDKVTTFTEPRRCESFELTGMRRRHRLAGAKTQAKEIAMKWKTPVIIEIAVGLEINAYACAEVK